MRTKYLAFVLALLSCSILQGQDATHTSTVTLSAGGDVASYNWSGQGGGPSFSGTYEYRLWKYFAVEAGVNTILPSRTGYGQIFSIFPSGTNLSLNSANPLNYSVYPYHTRDVVTLLPFGFRGILPLSSGRLELFAGFGGAYAFNRAPSNYNALLGQASLGGRFRWIIVGISGWDPPCAAIPIWGMATRPGSPGPPISASDSDTDPRWAAKEKDVVFSLSLQEQAILTDAPDQPIAALKESVEQAYVQTRTQICRRRTSSSGTTKPPPKGYRVAQRPRVQFPESGAPRLSRRTMASGRKAPLAN